MSAEIPIDGVSTLAHATLLVSNARASCCGVHRDGRPWIGFGYHVNDNEREVVAAAVVLFLPASDDDIRWAQEQTS